MIGNLKTELLEGSNNGLAFFKIFFGEKLHEVSLTRFKNVKNPFYDDKNEGFSIYQDKKGKWRYKDYGDSSYQGDCFDFYALVYRVDVKKDFTNLLIVMKRALAEGSSKAVISKASSDKTDLIAKAVVRVKLNEIEFSQKAIQFWAQYNITKEILLLNGVSQVRGYHEFYSNGDDRCITLNQDLVFVYKVGGFYKFYSPDPKRFWSVGAKTVEYRFGERFQLENNTMFLVGGEKDVMALHALGYQAFCLSSETAMPSSRFIKGLFEDNMQVVVLYDNDEAGHRGAEKLSKKLSWEIADLSSVLDENTNKTVKDISDYIKLGLPLDRLKAFLNQFQNEYKAQDFEDLQVTKVDMPEESGQEHRNYMPEFVYKHLPLSLKEAVVNFDYNRRDLVLVGCLGVLSNIIRVTGVYDHKIVFPNLFIFITAPASAGKGDLAWAKKLGKAINEKFKQEYNRANEEYKTDKKNNEKPYRKRLFISGNASHSALLQQLFVNGGEGIMLETEADTLNNALDNDWGNFSYVLRQVYEFETVSKLRREEDEIVEVERPRLSVVLTGTKDQLLKLVPSPENGLFSRFLFMELPIIPQWRNPFEKKSSLDNHYESLSSKFLGYFNLTRDKHFSFELTDEQIRKFNSYHSDKQDHDNVMLGAESIASVRRMAGMHFRLAMLLSIIRSLDEESQQNNVMCQDVDFQVSYLLIKWFSKHTEKIFNQLPKKIHKHPELKKEIAVFCDKLSDEFTFGEAKGIADDMGIAFSTMEGYIRKLLKIRLVERYKQGVYKKLNSEDSKC
jgi:5S rRNA maturation endonuclease (ribonuclease M5)